MTEPNNAHESQSPENAGQQAGSSAATAGYTATREGERVRYERRGSVGFGVHVLTDPQTGCFYEVPQIRDEDTVPQVVFGVNWLLDRRAAQSV